MSPEHSPDTAARILDAAEEVFADVGFAGARVNAIAKAADINKAMLYYYFDSKEGLYNAVLERVFGEVLALAASRMATPDEESIADFLRGYRGVLRSHPHFVKIMVRELADGGERLIPLIQPRLQLAMGSAVGGLAQAQAAGTVNQTVNPLVALPILVAPFILFQLANPLFSAATGAPVEALMPLFDQTAEEILLRGLLAPSREDS